MTDADLAYVNEHINTWKLKDCKVVDEFDTIVGGAEVTFAPNEKIYVHTGDWVLTGADGDVGRAAQCRTGNYIYLETLAPEDGRQCTYDGDVS